MTLQELTGALGATIRAHREAAGLTQESLAERAELSTNWVSQLERGRGQASLDSLERLCVALGVTLGAVVSQAVQIGPEDADIVELIARVPRLSARDRRLLLEIVGVLEREAAREG